MNNKRVPPSPSREVVSGAAFFPSSRSFCKPRYLRLDKDQTANANNTQLN